MSAPIWPLLGGQPVASALSGGQVIVGTPPDFGPCPRCGTNRLTVPNVLRCDQCASTAPWGTMHGVTPSAPPTVGDWTELRRVEGDRDAARDDVERHERALRGALVAAEQALRDLRVAAGKLGAAEERLTGRAAVSVTDSQMARVRNDITASARRLEATAWSPVQ